MKKKNKISNKSRIVAGYCWEWKTKKFSNDDEYDINLQDGTFKMKWNLSNSKTWAIDENSINEVGFIHTCQGLEFDYIGVIIGNDMKYDGEKIITDFNERAKTDKSLSGIKKMYKENKDKALKLADEIVKNTYRTLMTRGNKGCYIYCTDEKLRDYLKERMYGFSSNITAKEISTDSTNVENKEVLIKKLLE